MTSPTRLLADRYEVRGLIGRGGMADVHAGFDTRLGREVAIKILRSELARDPSFLQRFRREAQSAAGLNHPSIVAVFDSGEETEEHHGQSVVQPFIVMEYVHGTTLRERLAEEGALPADEACRIMAQVLQALEYSHRHGIIHRDIKPGNVMVTSTGVAKVMDFGIARAIADSAATMTNTSIVIGTAQYLSPEQAQGREIDARSDVYSAGALLYELVAGRTPFVGESPVSIAYQHVGEPPQPPSVFNDEVPGPLDVVILHALAKDPDERYQSAAEFAEDVEAVLAGRQTHAESAAVAAGTLAPSAMVSQDTEMHGAIAADHEESGKRKRPWLIPLIVGLVALVSLLGFLASQGAFDQEPEQVAVPQLVGTQDAEAQQLLSDLGLVGGRQTANNTAAVGTVISQDPAADSNVPPGSTITYTVSSGPASIKVPDLRNFEQSAARNTLAEQGLSVGAINPVDSKDVGQGNVVSTEPKAGSDVTEGTSITLNVSTGRVAVPSVVGLSRDKAINRLKNAGLGRSFTPVASSEAPGTVLSQSYQEGEKVPVGTVLELTVADEPVPTQTETVTVAPTPSEPPPPQDPPTDQPPPNDEPTPEPDQAPDGEETTPEPEATDPPETPQP